MSHINYAVQVKHQHYGGILCGPIIMIVMNAKKECIEGVWVWRVYPFHILCDQ